MNLDLTSLLRFRVSFGKTLCRALPALASLLMAAPSAHAALSASFNAATDVPVTAASYSPSGEVDFTLNFAPAPGTNLTVVKNTGLPFIDGAFSNLANGATVNLSHNGKTYPFVAWYYGGEGNNDLVLLWAHTKLAAWGWNDHGTLGDGTLVQRDVPVMVDRTGVLADKTIVQVSCGTYHTLALTTEGRVYAWGKNGFLGFTATTPGSFSLPAPVNTDSGVSALHGKTVVAVAAGGNSYSLALCSDGSLVSWGYNPFGELGDNSQTSREMPVLVNTTAGLSALAGKTVTSIAAGESFNLALCSDGSLVSWGRNHYGQLGDNSQTNRWVPVLVDRELGRSALAGKAVRSLAAAASSSLVFSEDGSVVGWGLNQHGNLGEGTMTNRLTPTVMNTEAGVSFLHGRQVNSLVAGQQHTIILCSDGTLAACGWGYQGRLGFGSSGPVEQWPFPQQVNAAAGESALFGKTVTALSAGLTHSMALCSDGTVVAWGDNTYGQIGSGGTQSSYLKAVAVNAVAGTSALAGQRVTALAGSAPDARFSVVVYGVQATPEITINGNGMEIANGDTTPSQSDHTIFNPTVVQGSGATRTFTTYNSGAASLNLTGNPQVTISGPNASDFTVTSQPAGSLAFGVQSSFQVTFNPNATGLRTAVVNITNDDTDESTYTFTIQGVGVSADFTISSASDVPLTTDGLSVSGNAVFTLNFAPEPGTNLTVVKNTGTLFIEGAFSNLANGATVNLSFGGKTYTFVAWYYGGAGNNDLVLLWKESMLAVWGSNWDNQIGVTGVNVRSPTIQGGSNSPLAGKTIVQVAQGVTHTLVLTTEGKVYASGNGSYGKLGVDLAGSSYSLPTAVNVEAGVSALAGKTVVAVAAGERHSLAMCSDGTVCAWGDGSSGQLGTYDFPAPFPLAVATFTDLAGKVVTGIAAGRFHSLAVCSDGTVAAWGSNAYGQCGYGTSESSMVPKAVSRAPGTALHGKTVVAVAGGMSHSLALCSDGTLAAWGVNGGGQLGDGTTTNSLAPVTVSAAEGQSALFGKTVTAISTGDSHNLALCSDGTVAAWGANGNGRLGDSTAVTFRSAPVAVSVEPGVSALSGKVVLAVAAGAAHNLALCSDGTLTAWGLNAFGALGNGDSTGTSLAVPTLVRRSSGSNLLEGETQMRLASPMPGSESSIVILPYKPRAIRVAGVVMDGGVPVDSVTIAHNDTTPSLTDMTDYGNVPFDGSTTVEHQFAIANDGLERLDLMSGRVTLIGHTSDFTLSVIPSSFVLGKSQTTFRIAFKPVIPGLRQVTVRVLSNDMQRQAYDFKIQGMATTAEIQVRHSATVLLTGAVSQFGNVGLATGVARRTFVIQNLGNVDLTGIAITKTSDEPEDFMVVTSPSATIVPGGSTTFTVEVRPSAPGTRNALLSIASNDFDENPFNLHLKANGVETVNNPTTAKPLAVAITAFGATLTAEANAKGSERQVFFDYGTTTSFGNRVEGEPATITGSAPAGVSAVITGLQPNTTYYFRSAIEGLLGSTYGAVKTFRTSNPLPVAVADSAIVLPGGQVVIPVLTNDTDPGDVLSIASFTQPAPTAGKVTKVGNTLVFTAAPGFNGGTFSYTAGDANKGKSTPATVTLTLGTCEIGPDVTIPADSPPYALAVTANAPFGVIENASWLSFLPPAANATSVTFIPAPNSSKTARTATVNVGGQTHTVTQLGVSELPVLTVPAFIPNAAISANYDLAIPTQNGPVTYTATGLPKGLTLSHATGRITGYPTEAKTSAVTVKAKNVQGDSNSITFNITVLDIPASVVGTFTALVEPDTTLTDKLGGHLTMTVTKTGGVTGTLKLGAGSHPFTGRLNTAENPATPDPVHAMLRASVKRAGKINVELLVRLNDEGTNTLTGEVTLPGAEPVTLDLEGSRHVWDARTNAADDFKGYYTVALQPTSTAVDIPQGDGFLTFTVTPAGAVAWSGQLADGTAITPQMCTLWADGRVPLFVVFGKGVGSLMYPLSISASTRLVTGPLRWHKKSQVVRAYADGFVESITLQASGGEYLPPGTGKTLLDLTAPASYGLDFLDGGINNVANFADLDQTLTLSSKHVPTTSGANPAQVKLTKIDLTKGTFTGTLTLKDANPFNESLPQISRPVTFQGVIVSSLQMGTGYFLLPAISGPPANVTKSAMTSGQVRIQPLAP